MALTPRYLVEPTFGPIPNFPYCGAIRRPLPYPGANGLNQSIKFESYAPYIVCRFQDPNTIGRQATYSYFISTGNLAGGNRSASIKSMQYGSESAGAINLEIIDSSGDDFVNFYASLTKNSCLPEGARSRNNLSEGLKVAIDFGWIFTGSSGVTSVYSNTFANRQRFIKRTGPFLYFLLHKIQVNYDGGIWKYKVELKSQSSNDPFRSADRTVGRENHLVKLIDASSVILQGDCKDPNRPNFVMTTRKNLDGTWSSFNFENSDERGPTGKWPGYQDTPLNSIRKQLDAVVTDRGKGITMFYNCADPTQTLFLMEGSFENCRRTGGRNVCGDNFLGTYVVNGGDISPVIEFNPEIKFVTVPTNNTGNISAGAYSSRARKIPTCDGATPQSNQGATIVSTGSVREQQVNTFSPNTVADRIAKATRAHIEAAKSLIPGLGQIEGDLVIQGDPRMVWPHQIKGATCSIIFVNPFSLKQSFGQLNTPQAGKTFAYWLANPPTNAILSKSNVQVLSVDHDITDGKWTTKLKIKFFPNATAN